MSRDHLGSKRPDTSGDIDTASKEAGSAAGILPGKNTGSGFTQRFGFSLYVYIGLKSQRDHFLVILRS